MATFRPVARNIATTPENVAQYLARLEELNKLRRPTDVAQGFGTDKAPMAFALPQARGVSQVLPSTQISQVPITPSSMVSAEYQTPTTAVNPARNINDFYKAVEESKSPKISNVTQDGGVQLSTGQVYYQDGTWRESPEAQRTQIPTSVFDFGTGRALYSDGKVRSTGDINLKDVQSGKTVTGIQAIQELLFPNGGLSQSRYYPGTSITQYFGENPNKLGYSALGHRGVDFSVVNQPLTAPFNGKVVQAGWDRTGFGNSVLIQLDNGSYIRLSHLSQINVRPGDQVSGGKTMIGITGNTGNSTGYHLDVMTYDANGRVVDPATFSADASSTISELPGQEITPDKLSSYEYTKQENLRRTGDPSSSYKGETQSIEELSKGLSNAAVDKKQNALGDIVALTGSVTGIPELGLSELVSGDIPGAVQKVSETVAETGRKNQLPEYGVSEKISEFGSFLEQSKQKAKEFISGFTNPPAPQTLNATDIIPQGLNIKSSLDEAKGLLTQIGTMQPGDLTKTTGREISGINQKGFTQPINPYNTMGVKPIGQAGFAGNVPMETAPKSTQPMSIDQTVQQAAETVTPFNQPIYNTNKASSTPSKSSSKPSSSESSKTSTQSKASSSSSQKASTQTKTTSQKSTQNPYSKPAQNVYTQTKQPQSKAQLPKLNVKLETIKSTTSKPSQKQQAPKTSVFKKVVSKVTSFFKKK